MRKIFVISLFILGLNTVVKGADGHDHKENENHEEKENPKHDHDKEKRDEHQGHGDEDEKEGGKNVGPNKGVTSFDEEKGFTLSEEARKKFSIETEMINGNAPWTLPNSALLLTGEEKNIYRLRDGAFKRIDIVVVEKVGNQILFRSLELKNGDSVVIKGVGFIRTAEVDVTSGESGHHH